MLRPAGNGAAVSSRLSAGRGTDHVHQTSLRQGPPLAINLTTFYTVLLLTGGNECCISFRKHLW